MKPVAQDSEGSVQDNSSQGPERRSDRECAFMVDTGLGPAYLYPIAKAEVSNGPADLFGFVFVFGGSGDLANRVQQYN